MRDLERRRYELPFRERLDVKAHAVHAADVFSFRFDHGWAIFTVCEATGELSVQSDWGSASYRWNTGSLGDDRGLKAFLARCDEHYVTKKIAQGADREWGEVFWRDETERHMKHEILRRRRERDVEGEYAREAWEAVDRFCSDADDVGVTAACMAAPRIFNDFFDSLHEWILMHDAPRRLFFETQLVPFFLAFLRTHFADGGAARRAS